MNTLDNLRAQANAREQPKPGTVTSIESQKKDRNRVSIFIDGKFAFGIHVDILISERLDRGRTLSETEIAELLDEDAYYRAREQAYHLLSYRQRSSSELSERLLRKDIPRHIVNRVIDRLGELQMIDDESFARNFAAARLRSKGYGPVRVRVELIRKGISRDIIDSTLDETYKSASLDELALAAATNILHRLQNESDPRKRRNKLTSYLTRRGFSYDHMGKALATMDAMGTEE